MPKTKEQKQKAIKNLEQELKQAKSLIFVDYYGLKVHDINDFRKLLKEKAYKYLVAKKTLLKIALDNVGLKHIDLNKITGGVGLVFDYTDEIESASLIANFSKKHKQLSIQGGIFDSEFVDAEKVKALAMLPGKAELRARVIATINAPLNNLVYVLQANLRNLVYVLSSIKK